MVCSPEGGGAGSPSEWHQTQESGWGDRMDDRMEHGAVFHTGREGEGGYPPLAWSSPLQIFELNYMHKIGIVHVYITTKTLPPPPKLKILYEPVKTDRMGHGE